MMKIFVMALEQFYYKIFTCSFYTVLLKQPEYTSINKDLRYVNTIYILPDTQLQDELCFYFKSMFFLASLILELRSMLMPLTKPI